MVEVSPDELAETSPGVVDVFDALGRQFFWADVVMVTARRPRTDVLDGEVVDPGYAPSAVCEQRPQLRPRRAC